MVMRLRGLSFLPLLVLLFTAFLKIMNRPKPMNTKQFASDLFFLLCKNGFTYRMARYIVAQAAHETGNFTSRIFLENNNLFGMKLALIRKTTGKGERYGHAYYSSIEDSVEDYRLYYQNWKYLENYSSIPAFVAALKEKKYFEADETAYRVAVERWYKHYFIDGKTTDL